MLESARGLATVAAVRLHLAAGGLVASAAFACAVASASPASNQVAGTPADRFYGCGVERWAVKTMSDPAAHHRGLKLDNATINQLSVSPTPVPVSTHHGSPRS